MEDRIDEATGRLLDEIKVQNTAPKRKFKLWEWIQ